jgi:uncharacterized protein GlcG (DUF336 family)
MSRVTIARVELAKALEMLERAQAEAERQGVAGSFAVVDAGGHLVALHRMDGASFTSTEIAHSKAWTAAAVGAPTWDAAQVFAGMQAGATSFVFAAAELTRGRFLAAAGGHPILEDGRVVGAIGTSGGSTEQALACARAALGQLG